MTVRLFNGYLCAGETCALQFPNLAIPQRRKVFQSQWMTLHAVHRLAQMGPVLLGISVHHHSPYQEQGPQQGSWQLCVSFQIKCCIVRTDYGLWSPAVWPRFCSLATKHISMRWMSNYKWLLYQVKRACTRRSNIYIYLKAPTHVRELYTSDS